MSSPPPTTPSLAKLFDLTGQVALITGGSRGLGLQIAQALGEYGATIVITARQESGLREAIVKLQAEDIAADYIVADMQTAGAAEAAVEITLQRYKTIDIVVNNAGAAWAEAAEDHSPKGWDKVMQVNVTSCFRLTQRAAKLAFIPQKKGAVINIASQEGLIAHPPHRLGTVAYNTSKGAVIQMTRALAAEWGPYGIRVNAIAPGLFPSALAAPLVAKHGAEIQSNIPLGKLGSDYDVKGVALLLASDAGGHITGQTIVVDGGEIIV